MKIETKEFRKLAKAIGLLIKIEPCKLHKYDIIIHRDCDNCAPYRIAIALLRYMEFPNDNGTSSSK